MGFLDTIKDRLNLNQDDGYYDDDEFDEYYDEEPQQPASAPAPEGSRTGILGNTRRPEAESVSVYTRSGHLVDNNSGSSSAGYGFGNTTSNEDTYSPEYRDSRSYNGRGYSDRGYDDRGYDDRGYDDRGYGDRGYGERYDDGYGQAAPAPAAPTQLGSYTPSPDLGARVPSGQLPPYVLKPTSYDDIQMVVRRVRTNQPVVLSFQNTNIETAKRILDFSLGLTCGIGGAVEEIGDRAFVVLPAGIELSDSDIDKLVADGTITR